MKYGRIEVTDIVNIVFTRNDVFEWQKSPTIKNCLVIKTPYATGDTYAFEYTDKYTKREFNINPNCSDFVGLDFIKTKEF